MKRINNLYDKIADYGNLYAAYASARLAKRYRQEVLCFTARLEENLTEIREELIAEKYRMGKYREFFIYEPKQRLVMAQPFRDRVIQWAIYRQLHPYFVHSYIRDSYACIDGRGVHSAVKRLRGWLREAEQEGRCYYLKLDISKYFYRIDHAVLLKILEHKIKDKRLLNLLRVIITSDSCGYGLPPGKGPEEVAREDRLQDKGMPVGNLSSQMFANLYMNELDQYCKRTLKIHYYIRYMDDVIILHKDKKQLHAYKEAIRMFLQEQLKLDLNNKTCVRPTTLGIEFCGYKTWSTHVKLRKSTALKMRRNLRRLKAQFGAGEIDMTRVMQTVHSYMGVLKHCNSYSLRKKIFGDADSENGDETGWFFLRRDVASQKKTE